MENPKNSEFVVYVVLDIYPCATGGMEIFYYKLLPEIANTENVILITACNKVEANNFRIFRIPKKILFLPGTTRFGSLFFTALTLIKLKDRVKIVHFPYTSSSGKWGFVFPFLRRYFNIKYLLQLHGGGMLPWRRFLADGKLFKYADQLVAVSTIIKKEYEKRTGRKIELVYPLVPFKKSDESRVAIRRKLKFDQDDKIILFVGSIKKIKGPDVLLKAFIKLGKEFIENHKLKLTFIGDGHLKDKLISTVKSAQFQNYIFFTGKLPYAAIPQYYKMSNIYVIPSEFEGTPKSLLEAMYNQMPIIASDVNGINDILTHEKNALLFENGNAQQLQNRIMLLVKNTEMANDLALNAFNHYKRSYQFKKTVEQLVSTYNFSNT